MGNSSTQFSGNMKWRNVLLDDLPEHEQLVLISYLGVYYRAVFDSEKKRFVFQDDPEHFLEISTEAIYWLAMQD